MLTTMLIVVFTHYLAPGVLCGILISVFFAHKVSSLIRVTLTYNVSESVYEATIFGLIFLLLLKN